MSALFSRILDTERSNRESVSRILSWVAHAERPLTVMELVAATSTASESSGIMLGAGTYTIQRLLGSFACMLHISDAVTDRLDSTYHDEPRPTVRLLHRSVLEFFLESGLDSLRPSSTPIGAAGVHAAIAGRCMDDLSYSAASAQNIGDTNGITFPLMDYAANHWRYHLDRARASNDGATARRVQELDLQAESLLKNNEIVQAQPRSSPRSFATQAFRPLQSDIHTTPGRGFLQGPSPDSVTSTRSADAESKLVRCFTTPLQQACFKGNTKLVARLLKRGANVNAHSGKFGSALQVAAYYGHADTVAVLLEADADINLEGGCFGTALQAAIAGDHDEVIDILLEHGADVNISSDHTDPPESSEIGNGSNGSPDYYDLPVREVKRVTTE
jgi:hypothetical protein